MALKFIIEEGDFKGLKPEIQTLYKVGSDNKYRLDADEDPDLKKKVEEFRTNNIELKKIKEELEKKYNGIDPDEVKKLKKREKEIDEKKLIDAGKLDEVVEQRVKQMQTDYQSQIEAQQKALDERDEKLRMTHAKLSEVLIDGEVTKAITAVGQIRPGAMQDIINRAKATWVIEDGKPVPKDGGKLIFGKDGKSLLTFGEWADILYKTSPYFFEPTKGSGGPGSGRGPGGVDKAAFASLTPTERLKQIHAAKQAGK
jgi:hypothetical protein